MRLLWALHLPYISPISPLYLPYISQVRLFRSKDVDGSGTLDMQEFVELVAESDMLNHRDAILHQGEAIRA